MIRQFTVNNFCVFLISINHNQAFPSMKFINQLLFDLNDIKNAYIMDNFSMEKDMEKELCYITTEGFIKDNGNLI